MFLVLMFMLKQQERSDTRNKMQRKRKRQRKRLKEESESGFMVCNKGAKVEDELDKDDERKKEIDSNANANAKNGTKGKKSVIDLINSIKSIPRSNNMKEARRSVPFFCAQQSIIYLACLMFIICLWLTQFVVLIVDGSTITDFDGATFYKASVGSRVRIACNGSHWNDDSVSLVLWFKGTVDRHSVPIYTVDARQRPLNGGARHFVSEAYRGRAKFITKSWPPYLDLDPIEADDQSEYRCRIDYRSKPRENFLIILFVLVPPKSVHIMDLKGRSLEQIYGPLSESSNLTLVCISKGGRPAPAITWRLPASSSAQTSSSSREKDSGMNEANPAKVIDDSYLTLNDFLALKRSGQLFSPSQHKNNYDNNNGNKNSSNNNNNLSSWQQNGINNGNRLQKYNNNDDDDESGQLMAVNGGSNYWPTLTFEANSSRSTTTANKPDYSETSSTNPINMEASFNRLEALWLNWRTWPEYEFYSRKLDEFVVHHETREMLPVESGGSSQEAPIFVKLNHEQRKRVQAGSGGNSFAPVGGQQSNVEQQQQLLTMEFHESITTSVNVLSFSHLNTVAAVGPPPLPSEADFSETKLTSSDHTPALLRLGGASKPVLECEASNLHYDIRLLIKLFAPPSLLGYSPTMSPTTSSSPVYPTSATSGSAQANQVISGNVSADEARILERQLVEAMQKALEANLKMGSSEVISTTTTKLTSLNDTSSSSLLSSPTNLATTNLATAALKQIKTESTSNNSSSGNQLQHAAELFIQSNNTKNSNSAISNNINIIYQQLSYAHQLSRSFSMLESATPSQSTTTGDEANGQSLVRTRLIALDVYLRPLNVRIDQPERPLSAGQFAEFGCTSRGSQPPAKLTWFKSGLSLDQKLSHTINDLNASTSISRLRLKLDRQDHGVQLVCRAENEHLTRLNSGGESGGNDNESSNQLRLQQQQNFLEDSITLTVHYSPKVKLELGNKMLTNAIREGSDMYFVCLVEAIPAVREITWLHNKRPVNETYLNSSPSRKRTFLQEGRGGEEESSGDLNTESNNLDGLIIINNSLVLQRVKMEQRGQYACLASNSEGISESNKIELSVLHAPICSSESKLIGGSHEHRLVDGSLFVGSKVVGLKSSVRLLCQMEANPASDLEISWYLNNSHTERRTILGPVKSDESLLNGNNSNLNEQEFGGLENHTNENENYTDQTNDWPKHSSGHGSSKGDKTLAEVGRREKADSLTTRLSNTNDDDKIEHTSRLVASTGLLKEPQTTRLAAGDSTKGTSQLNYLVDTNLDYGYLYCVARNSIGEQKRACIYEIRQADLGVGTQLTNKEESNFHSLPVTPSLECMAFNVTSSSALIGCDFREQQYFKPTSQQSSSADTSTYKFSIQVYKIPLLSSKINSNNDNNEISGHKSADINYAESDLPTTYLDFTTTNSNNADKQQLEANLTSALLREPIFLLNNLQASTSYQLHVRSIDTSAQLPLEPVSVVRFSTSSPQEAPFFQEQSSSISSTSNSSSSDISSYRSPYSKQQYQELTVEPVIEAHQSQKLLSALISTRSTNQFNGKDHQHPLNHLNHLNSSRARIYQQQQQQQQQLKQIGWLDKLWTSTNSLFNSIFGVFKVDNSSSSGEVNFTTNSSLSLAALSNSNRTPASSKQITNNKHTNSNSGQLMEPSNIYLVTSVCLILLASLTLVLFLHRYSSKKTFCSTYDIQDNKEGSLDGVDLRGRESVCSDKSSNKRARYESYSMSSSNNNNNCANSINSKSAEQTRSCLKGPFEAKKGGGDFAGSSSSNSNIDSESSFAGAQNTQATRFVHSNMGDANGNGLGESKHQFNNKPVSISDSLLSDTHSNRPPSPSYRDKQVAVRDSTLVGIGEAATKQNKLYTTSLNQQQQQQQHIVKNLGDYLTANFNQNNDDQSIMATNEGLENGRIRLPYQKHQSVLPSNSNNRGDSCSSNNRGNFATLDLAEVRNGSARLLLKGAYIRGAGNLHDRVENESQGQSQNQNRIGQNQQKELYNSLCPAASSSSLLLATTTDQQQQQNMAKSRSSLCLESLQLTNGGQNGPDITAYQTAHGNRHLISDANLILNSVSCRTNDSENKLNVNFNGSSSGGGSGSSNNDNIDHFLTNCAAAPSYPLVSSTFLLSSSSSASTNYAQGLRSDKYDENEGHELVRLVGQAEQDYYDCHLLQRELSHLNSESSSATSSINNNNKHRTAHDAFHHHHQQQHQHHQQHQKQHHQIHDNKRYSKGPISFNGNSSSVIETSDALYMPSNRGVSTASTTTDHLNGAALTNINRGPTNEMGEEVAVGVGPNKHLVNVLVMQPGATSTQTEMTMGQSNAIKRVASNCSGKTQKGFSIERHQQQAACHSSSLISDESSDCTWSPANCILATGTGTPNFTTVAAVANSSDNRQIDSYNQATQDQPGFQFIQLIPATTNCSTTTAAVSNSDNSSFASDVNLMSKMLLHESSFNSLQHQHQHQHPHHLLNLLNATAPGQQLPAQEVAQFNTCLSFNSPATSLNSANSSSLNGDHQASPSPLVATTTNNASQLQNEQQPLQLLHTNSQLIEYQQNQLQPNFNPKHNQQNSGNLYQQQHSKLPPSILKNSSAKFQQEQQAMVCLCNGQPDKVGNEAKENAS